MKWVVVDYKHFQWYNMLKELQNKNAVTGSSTGNKCTKTGTHKEYNDVKI